MFAQFDMVGKCCVTQFNTCSWLARFNIDLSKWFFINKLIVPKFMFMNGASNQQTNNIGWDIINAKPNVELTWSYSNYHSIISKSEFPCWDSPKWAWNPCERAHGISYCDCLVCIPTCWKYFYLEVLSNNVKYIPNEHIIMTLTTTFNV